jgi:MoaA/NifB/PqqE/SkfB family radical SAM enzyme
MTATTATKADTFLDRIGYRTRYFDDPNVVIERIIDKSIVPYQVELQPGRLKGKRICWLTCSYCYGLSSDNVADRLTPERYLAILDELANGSRARIDKVILAGYATDPLNYEYIDDLAERALSHQMVVGIHSKFIRASERLIAALTAATIRDTNYITISVDAGDSRSYDLTHGLKGKSATYDRVIANISALVRSKRRNGAKLDIATNYLLTTVNSDAQTVERGIENLVQVGVNSIRFSFPQLPRGFDTRAGTILPLESDIPRIYDAVRNIVEKFKSRETEIVVLDYDRDQGIAERRSFPCLARFIYPAVSYDGYLSHCSQSAAAHFRNMSLGNLQTRSFWDVFYDYDPADFWNMLERQHAKMNANDCRCDRKEHTVNQVFQRATAPRRFTASTK